MKMGKSISKNLMSSAPFGYDIEATEKANPNGEADTFIQAMRELGMID